MSRARALLLMLVALSAAVGFAPPRNEAFDPGAPLDALSQDDSWEKPFEPIEPAPATTVAAGEVFDTDKLSKVSETSNSDAVETAEPRGEQVLLRRGQRSVGGAVRAAGSTSAGGPDWLRTFVSLGAVIGLILLLAWGYRSLAASQSGMLLRARRPGVIDMVGRVNIGPRQSLCLVRVGSRMVLVGVTAERIAALDVIADPAVTAQLAGIEHELQSRTEFAESLEYEARGIEHAETELEAADSRRPRVGGIAGLSGRLAETLRRLQRSAVRTG